MKVSKEKFFSMLKDGNIKNFKIGDKKFYSKNKIDLNNILSNAIVYKPDNGKFVFLIFSKINNNAYVVFHGKNHKIFISPFLNSDGKLPISASEVLSFDYDNIRDFIEKLKSLAEKTKPIGMLLIRNMFPYLDI